MKCDVDGCDRPKMLTLPLCKTHRAYQRQGRDPYQVQKRFRYGPDAQCKIDGCSEKPEGNWLCQLHYQNSRYVPREVQLMELPKWSKVCHHCRQAKPWQEFIRASDVPNATCLECFKTRHKTDDKKVKTYDTQAALEEVRRLATRLDDPA